jgi:hypothetical protein
LYGQFPWLALKRGCTPFLFEFRTLTQQMQQNVLNLFLDSIDVTQAKQLPLFGDCA